MLVYTTPHPKKAFQSGVRPRWTLSRGVYVCVCVGILFPRISM